MEVKRKLFVFLNGVAYPLCVGYHVRLGNKWHFVDSNEYPNHYQLIKKCRVNTYRYPFVQFSKEKYDLVSVGEEVANPKRLKEIIGDVKLIITRK